MVFRSTHGAAVASAALAVLAVLAACSGSHVDNAPPRIASVPAQSLPGGTPLSLDLAGYVTDREGAALTYSVLAGGGAFAGSTYTNTFGTLGVYTVAFQVTDAAGLVATSTFDVKVGSADFAVVAEDGSGLLLLDTATNSLLRVAAASTPSFATGHADGRLVYQIGSDAARQLRVFDPYDRSTRRVGEDTDTYVTWRASTGDGRLIYTSGIAPDTGLFAYYPLTNLTTAISGSVGQLAGDTRINGDDLVFYERANGGQADIYYFDPASGSSTAVATEASDEQLRDVLADDGIVFSRIGAGGEQDLFYWRQSTGAVEIGTNLAALAPLSKSYAAGGSQGQVVFTVFDGVDTDLYFWEPATGLATAIATGGTYAFAAIGAGDEVVFRREVSGSEHDLLFYDLTDGTAGTVRDGSDLGAVLAVTGDGTTNYAIVQGSGALASISAVSLVAAPVSSTWVAGGPVGLGGTLGNGDVVAQRTDGTALARFDAAASGWGAPIPGAGLAFAGAGVDAGDFVYRLTAAAQTDLSMWDESAGFPLVVSSQAGDDAFAAVSANGTILFTRVIPGHTNADLFVWHPAHGETQLTDEDEIGNRHDFGVVGGYHGSR